MKGTAEWCHNRTGSNLGHVLRTPFLESISFQKYILHSLQDQPEVDGSPLAGDPRGNAHRTTKPLSLNMPNPRGGGTR